MAKLTFNSPEARQALADLFLHAAEHKKPEALSNLIERLEYLRRYGPDRPNKFNELRCEISPDIASMTPRSTVILTMTHADGSRMWVGGLVVHADGDVLVHT
jgi:hypothetical protein